MHIRNHSQLHMHLLFSTSQVVQELVVHILLEVLVALGHAVLIHGVAQASQSIPSRIYRKQQ